MRVMLKLASFSSCWLKMGMLKVNSQFVRMSANSVFLVGFFKRTNLHAYENEHLFSMRCQNTPVILSGYCRCPISKLHLCVNNGMSVSLLLSTFPLDFLHVLEKRLLMQQEIVE